MVTSNENQTFKLRTILARAPSEVPRSFDGKEKGSYSMGSFLCARQEEYTSFAS